MFGKYGQFFILLRSCVIINKNYMELIYLVLGLFALWVGAQLVVRASIEIAEYFNISQGFLGLFILALGTDLPELFVNTSGALAKRGGVDTSNLVLSQTIGTSLSQISLILGIAALVGVITISKKGLTRDAFVLVGSVVLLFLLSLDGSLSIIDGWILMLLYGFYFVLLLRTEVVFSGFKLFRPKIHMLWVFLSLLGGFAILVFASKLTIDGAVFLSNSWGVSQFFVGTFIVGLGTSLPELATAIAAIKNKASALAIGNLIGSNIFDVLFALGLGAAISGFTVHRSLLTFDIPILFLVSLFVVFLLKSNKTLDKKEAIMLIGCFGCYVVLKVFLEFA